jgi:hypothetical protein
MLTFSKRHLQAGNPYLSYERDQIAGSIRNEHVRYDDITSMVSDGNNRAQLFNKVSNSLKQKYKGDAQINPHTVLSVINTTIGDILDAADLQSSSIATVTYKSQNQLVDVVNDMIVDRALKTIQSEALTQGVYARNIDLNMIKNNKVNRSIYATPPLFPNVTPYMNKHTKVNRDDQFNSNANHIFGVHRF